MDLQNKVALITGAGKRLGRAMALGLADLGCNVVVHYNRSADAATETAAELRRMGVQAWTLPGDLDNEAAVAQLVPQTLEQAGRLDVLINNASIFEPEQFLDADPERWDRTMMINLKAPFLLSQAFARTLPEGHPGKIINLLDSDSLRPRNHHFAYTISKVGLTGLTQATAHALAAQNIQVNGIAVGALLPDINNPDEESFQKSAAKVPVGRTGHPDDIVAVMRYLLRDADFVTGEIIRLDGGVHLK